ncbi:alkaline shock response membrane anchor protein AmaP [Streptomyces sp. MBT42]|uniref:DUF6286 domain-containing Asp23/Gls24 family envelope stress response protein n=1 Tax=Streptomyces sp. MBT42 TaxID=1488373 RepID=UPI001E4903DD|nr:DUF6286 domain-containing protein [Streptomyces sp. MBT42]MCD2469026.1 alkaline shock response membrane anchor protein AmaP [Streptomyces sp. MBT42]
MTVPRQASAPPRAERGTLTVADRAVRRIVRQAATEALGGAGTAREVSVARRGAREARVRVAVELAYPTDLAGQGERVRRHVMDRATALSGLAVSRADVAIASLSAAAPGTARGVRGRGDAAPDRQGPTAGSEEAATDGAVTDGTVTDEGATDEGVPAHGTTPPRARRPWSGRRLPAAATALVVATAAGALLVRGARGGLTPSSALRSVPLTDARWIGAGAALAVLGVVLVVLALTPGMRRWLPLVRPDGDTRAAIDRSSVGLLLRDAVLGVDGVSRVEVRSGRRRRRVRVLVAHGSTDGARQAAEWSASAALSGIGLGRPGRLSVTSAPDKQWRPPKSEEAAP